MLYAELEKIAPPLASFMRLVSPELREEDVSVLKPQSIRRSISGRGRCYLFSYRNPVNKGKPQLPYYHVFPMVISLEQEQNHLLGLNPFYLPPLMRENFVNVLLSRLLGDIENPDTRCSISYKMLSKYRSSLGAAFPCIKKYRHERMSPVVIEMKPSLWRDFYLGDISKKHQSLFIGRSPASIWSDSEVEAIKQARSRITRIRK